MATMMSERTRWLDERSGVAVGMRSKGGGTVFLLISVASEDSISDIDDPTIRSIESVGVYDCSVRDHCQFHQR